MSKSTDSSCNSLESLARLIVDTTIYMGGGHAAYDHALDQLKLLHAETVEACAAACDTSAATCEEQEKLSSENMWKFEYSVRAREAKCCAIRVRDLVLLSSSQEPKP